MNNNDDLVQKRELEEEEEMPLAEKDLASDAPWKRIQQNTFTRWCNEHLKVANKQIVSLETDYNDGLRLIALVEVLSHKRIPRFNKRPTMRPMKLENVSLALKFLEDEGIRLVNIDSGDIVDGRMKLILGLVWTLILHYSISMPMWEDEGEGIEQKGRAPTPKERLMGWINSKLPDNPIRNFTTDWNSGKAIGALVDAVAPGLCPDWEDWDPANALDNAREAMKAAEDWLDVPQVMRPEDMVNPKVDDLSMMTYLSKFPSAKLKPNAPLRPRSNAKKVRAYGPGIEPEGNAVSKPTHFTIETFSAGHGKVEVDIENPNGQKEDCQVTFNNDKNRTYTVVYTPKMSGKYKIIIHYSKTQIPKSPFIVNITDVPGDAKKCSAKGPGLQPVGLIVGQQTYFEIFTAVFNPKKAYATGRGIQPKGIRANEDAVFTVHTKDAGEAELRIQIIGPGRLLDIAVANNV
ncbi:filamin-A-like [Saccoglossus kowalevskii]